MGMSEPKFLNFVFKSFTNLSFKNVLKKYNKKFKLLNNFMLVKYVKKIKGLRIQIKNNELLKVKVKTYLRIILNQKQFIQFFIKNLYLLHYDPITIKNNKFTYYFMEAQLI